MRRTPQREAAMNNRSKSALDWDARYRAAEASPFGDAPNEYLREFCERPDFSAKTALCLADGDGRNGTWLAQRGLQVTAVDHSVEATRLALLRDEGAGVTVERMTADLAVWQPESGRTWDLVCILYLHGAAALRERAVRTAYAALAPGGWLVLEGFSKAQAERPGMGPDDPDKLYDLDEIRGWIPQARPVEAWSGCILLDEGRRHAGKAEVDRLSACRPSMPG